MLRSVIVQALELNSSLLSGFPRQLANSLPQKLAIPVLYFILISWVPFWWLHRSKKPKPSLAIGQFLLFTREAYWQIGGHKAVKARIIEDVWLGIEISRHGGRHIAIDLSPVVSCNMYSNMGEMWEGFIKWIYSVAALSPAALIGMLLAGYIFLLAPFYWLWNELFIVNAPLALRAVIISQVAIILTMRWLVDNNFKEPVISTILHPVGFLFLYISAIYAGAMKMLGTGIHWKNRFYSKKSTVE
jgi:chlorobactene glucosyltransferase